LTVLLCIKWHEWMKWNVLRTVNVNSQRDRALFTGGGLFYSEHRATGAIGTLCQRPHNRGSRKRRGIRWAAIIVSGQEIAAKKGRDGARSDISTGYSAHTKRRWKRVPSSKSWCAKGSVAYSLQKCSLYNWKPRFSRVKQITAS